MKSFDKTNLKHVETDEKQFMPSAQGNHDITAVNFYCMKPCIEAFVVA